MPPRCLSAQRLRKVLRRSFIASPLSVEAHKRLRRVWVCVGK
jgi:hypothetical protein